MLEMAFLKSVCMKRKMFVDYYGVNLMDFGVFLPRFLSMGNELFILHSDLA